MALTKMSVLRQDAFAQGGFLSRKFFGVSQQEISDVSVHVRDAADEIKYLAEDFRKYVKGFFGSDEMFKAEAIMPDAMKWFRDFSVPKLIIHIRLFMVQKLWYDRLLVLVSFFFDGVVLSSMYQDILKAAVGLIKFDNQATAQSWSTETQPTYQVINTLITAIISIGGLVFLGTIPPMSAMDKMIKRLELKALTISRFSNGTRGFVNLFEYCAKAVDQVCRYSVEHLGGCYSSTERRDAFSKFVRDVYDVDNDLTYHQVSFDGNLRNHIRLLRDQSIELDAEMLEMKTVPPIMKDHFFKARVALQKIWDRILKCPLDCGVRKAPFCFFVYGDTNIGKSVLVNAIVNELADRKGIARFNRCYARNVNDNYWSEYRQQWAVVYDDWYATKGHNGVDSVTELIDMVTNAPYQLNLAALNEKGRPFLSEFIALAGNTAFPNSEFTVTHQAAFRRRNFMVRAILKPGAEKVIGSYNHLEFVRVSPTEPGRDLSDVMSWQQMHDLLLSEYEKYDAHQEELVRHLRGANVCVAQMSEETVPKIVEAHAQADDDVWNRDVEVFKSWRHVTDPIIDVSRAGNYYPFSVYFTSDWSGFNEVDDIILKCKQIIDRVSLHRFHVQEHMLAVAELYSLLNEGVQMDSLTKRKRAQIRNMFRGKTGFEMLELFDIHQFSLICDVIKTKQALSVVDQWQRKYLPIYCFIVCGIDKCGNPLRPRHFFDLVVHHVYDRTDPLHCQLARELMEELHQSSIAVAQGLDGDEIPDLERLYDVFFVLSAHIKHSPLSVFSQKEMSIMVNSIRPFSENSWVEGYIESSLFKDFIAGCYLTERIKFIMSRLCLSYYDARVMAVKQCDKDAEGTWLADIYSRSMIEGGKVEEIMKKEFSKPREFWVNFTGKHPILTKTIFVVSGLLVLKTVGNLLHGFLWPEEEEAEDQAYYSGSTKIPPKARPRKYVNSAEVQAVDNTADNLIDYRLAKNMFRFVRDAGNGKASYALNTVQIRGKLFLINKHAYYKLTRGEDCRLESVSEARRDIVYKFKFNPDDWVLSSDMDVALFELPCVSSSKDIIPKFIKETDIQYLGIIEGVSVGVTNTRAMTSWSCSYKPTDRQVGYRNFDKSEVFLRRGWYGTHQTKNGDCGAVLVVRNNRLQGGRRFAGIHCALEGGKCLSQLVTQETLNQMVKEFDVQVVDDEEILDVDVDFEAVANSDFESPLSGNFEIVGVAKTSFGLPCKTKIVPSPMFDQIKEHVTEPSVLHPGDDRYDGNIDPMLRGMEKYTDVSIPFPLYVDQALKERAVSKFRNLKPNGEKRVLTENEAINGILAYDHYEALPMKTSPGIPYVNLRGYGDSGKSFLFKNTGTDVEPKWEVSHSALRDRLDARLAMCKQGKRYNVPWLALLKDERRKIEKVKAGKTRVFMMAPVDYTILVRMYFLAFCAAFLKARCEQNGSTLGINVTSSEWAKLYHRLREVSCFGFDGDVENHDGKIKSVTFESFEAGVDAFYDTATDEDRLVRKVLLDELKCRYVVFRVISPYIDVERLKFHAKFYVAKIFALPSGHPLTAIVGTHGTENYMDASWMLIMADYNRFDMLSLRRKDELTRLAANGDDNITTVSTVAQPYYNFSSVRDKLAEYGHVYTPGSKDDSDYTVRNLMVMTYLKRRFKIHENRSEVVLAPIAVDTIYELLNWVSDDTKAYDQLIDNYGDAVEFAYHHGYKFLNDFIKDCEKHFLDADLDYPRYTISGMDEELMDRYFV